MNTQNDRRAETLKYPTPAEHLDLTPMLSETSLSPRLIEGSCELVWNDGKAPRFVTWRAYGECIGHDIPSVRGLSSALTKLTGATRIINRPHHRIAFVQD